MRNPADKYSVRHAAPLIEQVHIELVLSQFLRDLGVHKTVMLAGLRDGLWDIGPRSNVPWYNIAAYTF